MSEEPWGFTYGISFSGYQECVAPCNEGNTILFFNEGKVTVDVKSLQESVNTPSRINRVYQCANPHAKAAGATCCNSDGTVQELPYKRSGNPTACNFALEFEVEFPPPKNEIEFHPAATGGIPESQVSCSCFLGDSRSSYTWLTNPIMALKIGENGELGTLGKLGSWETGQLRT